MEELHWYWFGAGILLIALEALMPGAVLLWFGVAALATGVVSLLTDASLDQQMMIFSALALVCTVVFRRWRKHNPPDKALNESGNELNRPGQELIGKDLSLITEIHGGTGRVKVADSSWRCRGPELPKGSIVRVIDVESGTLIVEAIDEDD